MNKINKNLHILFYTSSHGFGHSTRMVEVANRIPLIHKVTFATMAPEWIYKINAKRPYFFRNAEIDTGVIQSDLLTVLPEETLKRYDLLLSRRDEIIENEVKWIKENNVSLIVGDIPPLAFPVAKTAGIPSLGISNFSWDWIYEPMVEDFPEYNYILDDIRKDYREADLVLRLPLSGDMSVFPRLKEIPFIARKSNRSSKEVREKLGISGEKKFILLSLGGHEMARINFSRVIEEFPDFIMVSFNSKVPLKSSRFVLVDNMGDLLHEEVLGAADFVICKPGYGIVSEIIANKTPALYVSRKDYIENNILVEGLKSYAVSEEINLEDFLSGRWRKSFDKLALRKSRWPDMDCSGATAALAEVFSLTGLIC